MNGLWLTIKEVYSLYLNVYGFLAWMVYKWLSIEEAYSSLLECLLLSTLIMPKCLTSIVYGWASRKHNLFAWRFRDLLHEWFMVKNRGSILSLLEWLWISCMNGLWLSIEEVYSSLLECLWLSTLIMPKFLAWMVYGWA